MIKWLNGILGILILGLTGWFALLNTGEVEVILPAERLLTRVPLFLVAFVPLFLGFASGVAYGWLSGLKHRHEARRLARQNRDLERELTNLRNLPLEDDLA